MKNGIKLIVAVSTAALLVTIAGPPSSAEPNRDTVITAMKRASSFMADKVSTHGGYVNKYSADLSKRWGEVPARDSQIVCQPPGTPSMGMLYLEAYKASGEWDFLRYAEMAADALIWGQHPAGGWHYLIDFDMPGLRKWYDEVASRCWGWEEYYHYYGNCSFDDRATYAPAKFLLELYMTTLDPKYRVPLLKALDFILEAQYPCGGWPQRYPLMYDFPHGGHDDYTHYYTYNDGAIQNNIFLLFEAWEKLGNEEYRKAAVRGMDFYIISQQGEPQAGWAQQYTMDMRPGAARTYEPAAVSAHRTVANIRDLMTYYTMTGDRRYLDTIPRAIAWLEKSAINSDPSKKYTHAGFYEPGTNDPLFYHFDGTNPDNHKYRVDHDIEGSWWYRRTITPDFEGMKRRFERVSALSPEQALAEYAESKKERDESDPVDTKEVESILSSMDDRGAWVTDIGIRQYDKGMLEVPLIEMKGIDVSVFIRNTTTLIRYLKSTKR